MHGALIFINYKTLLFSPFSELSWLDLTSGKIKFCIVDFIHEIMHPYFEENPLVDVCLCVFYAVRNIIRYWNIKSTLF